MLKRWLEDKPEWLSIIVSGVLGGAVFYVLLSLTDMFLDNESGSEAFSSNVRAGVFWILGMSVWFLVLQLKKRESPSRD